MYYANAYLLLIKYIIIFVMTIDYRLITVHYLFYVEHQNTLLYCIIQVGRNIIQREWLRVVH